MALTTVTKEFKFEAAHQLLNHDGKCRNLHGHSYKVVLSVVGDINTRPGEASEGMVMDYYMMKDWWDTVEPRLDHRNLNETLGPDIGPTTAENIALYLLDNARRYLGRDVDSVTVCETASTSATVYG